MRAPILYISYDGVLEPLGQSQVLSYLEGIAKGRSVHLLSYEKFRDWQNGPLRSEISGRISRAGIVWHPTRYHKQMPLLATAWDVVRGTALALHICVKHRLSLIHARSYVAGVIGLIVKRTLGARLVFDMRGFWADERVDGGLWPSDGYLFSAAKHVEKRLLLGADHVVSLTHAALREMSRFDYLDGAMPPATVIPTCADLAKFSPVERKRANELVVGYVGSTGTWYLFDEVARAFKIILEFEPSAKMLVITRDELGPIHAAFAAAHVPLSAVEVRAVSHSDVPAQIRRMDLGMFFIKPHFSKQASAPTKLAEFLGCGVPCLSNRGVGDMAEVLEGGGVGVAIRFADGAEVREGIARALALSAEKDIAARCVEVAKKNFSLEEGISRYESVYRSVEAG